DRPVIALDFADLVTDDNCRATVFVCELWHDEQRIASSVSSFAPSKHLELADPALKVDMALTDETLTFDVSAASLARFVELELDGADVVFSDNYFDMPAGSSLRVSTTLPAGWTLEQA